MKDLAEPGSQRWTRPRRRRAHRRPQQAEHGAVPGDDPQGDRGPAGGAGLATKEDLADLEAGSTPPRRRTGRRHGQARGRARQGGRPGRRAAPSGRRQGGSVEKAQPPSRPPPSRPELSCAAGSTPSSSGGAWRPAAHRAATTIAAGRVLVGGVPGRQAGPHGRAGDRRGDRRDRRARFVGRGGEKLDAALDRFDVDVDGRRALDAGSSTGGFTDCLLQRGAASVVAVDVGYGQLDLRLRRPPGHGARAHQHPRLTLDGPAEPFPLIVADLSFISLRTVAPALLGLAAPGADLVAAGEAAVRGRAGRGQPRQGRHPRPDGVVAGARGGASPPTPGPEPAYGGHGVAPPGADGNVEFLFHLVAGRPTVDGHLAPRSTACGRGGRRGGD